MNKFQLSLLFALLAIVGNMQAQQKQYQIHYVVNMHNISDSTALYQRIATNNASEPYILGDIVRWMHCNRHRYNEPVMIAEREFGLYKDKYVTVTIDGEQYFISGYDISGNDASGYHWVEKSLPQRKKHGLPWGKILLFGIGGILLLGWLFGARGGSSSHSGGGSSSNSYRDKLDEIERAKREKEREEAEKRRKEEQERQAKWREQLKREGKW